MCDYRRFRARVVVVVLMQRVVVSSQINVSIFVIVVRGVYLFLSVLDK